MKLLNNAKGAASRYMNNNKEKELGKYNPNESLEVKKKPNNEPEIKTRHEPSKELKIEPEKEPNKIDVRKPEHISYTSLEAQQKDNPRDLPTEEKPTSLPESNIQFAGAVLPSSLPSQTVSTTFKRQQSKQTEIVRKNHVEDALKKWKDIVEFCREV